MRRFVSRSLFCQYNNILTKGFPVRLSHFPGSADIKPTNAEDAVQSRERGTLFPQRDHRHLPILDSPVPSPTVPPQAEDEILMNLNLASTLSQLLESVSKNVKSMQEEHLTSAIEKVIHFQKSPRTAFTVEALHTHEGFGKLCHRIRKVAPSIRDPQQLINYLKAMLLCKVASNTRIVQTLLQMLKGKVNDLGIQQIIFLNFLLKKLDGSLVDALKIALPIVFETQLRIQLDLDNVELMRESLHYATVVRSSPQTIKFIADGLCSNQSWTPSQTCSVVWSLGKVRNLRDHALLLLLELALRRAGSAVDEFGAKELERTLAVIGENYSAKNKFWYNEKLLEATAERVVREKWPFEATFTIGRTFSKMSFVNLKFLDYLSTLIVEAKNLSTMQAFHLISPFSMANYKPANFQSMMDTLLRFDVNSNEFSILLRFALASAVLGVYPYMIIQSLFKESVLEKFLNAKEATYLDWMQLDLLQRAVRINCSDYPGPYPDKAVMEMAKKKHLHVYLQSDARFPLKAALETALGGSAYVESGMFTEYGHYVDHVLVLRPGFYPVAINTTPSNSDSVRHVEDIKVSPGCQMLLILVERPNFFAANAKRLRGVYALEQHTLEKAGYNVLALDLEKWQSLLEYERIPFLMQEIHKNNIFPVS